MSNLCIKIMELVSVIIPYFKKKKFIKKTISSVLNQTYSNLEVIIVYDDEDQTDLKYLKKIINKKKKIKILTNKKNLGAGLSRNRAISISKGKYICFLDADDYFKKDKIKKQIFFMKKNNFKISHTSYKIIDENDTLLSSRYARNFFKTKDLLKSCDIGLSTVILEKKLFSKKIKFPNLKTKEDFVLWLKILMNNEKIGGLNFKLTYWRRTDNSLSSSLLQKLSDGFIVYYKYMNFNFVKSIFYLLCLSLNYLRK